MDLLLPLTDDLGVCIVQLQTRPLPVRFEDATKFKHQPKKQHPLYQTSSNDYGQQKPNQSQFPQQWHGIQACSVEYPGREDCSFLLWSTLGRLELAAADSPLLPRRSTRGSSQRSSAAGRRRRRASS